MARLDDFKFFYTGEGACAHCGGNGRAPVGLTSRPAELLGVIVTEATRFIVCKSCAQLLADSLEAFAHDRLYLCVDTRPRLGIVNPNEEA